MAATTRSIGAPVSTWLADREVHVVVVVAGRGAVAGGVGLPARPGEPDLFVPDHVGHAEPVGVGDAPPGQLVAVRLVGAARAGVLEAARVGREVAGVTPRMVTA